MKVKPISPAEVTHSVPDFIIEAFNKLIRENWNGVEARVLQGEVMNIVSSNRPDDPRPSRRTVFDNHWLDVEDIYRKAGWKVAYDSPTWDDETYDAYFLFEK